jgi:hypothetical protein
VKIKNPEFPAALMLYAAVALLQFPPIGLETAASCSTKHSSSIIAHEIDIVDSTDPSPPAVYKAPRVAMVYPHASLLASIPCSDLNLGALCSSFSFSVSF